MERNLALDVAGAEISEVSGTFYRHAFPGSKGLQGSEGGGRWGRPRAYPVLYLGRPTESVVVEAYRHLVDDVEGMTGDLVGPRKFFTCRVNVTRILDLRRTGSRERLKITLEDLAGEPEPCQRIGQTAHQLALHGVIAPAATGLGETLALFERHLPASEVPEIAHETMWERLPPDPRSFRVLHGSLGDPA